MNGWEWRKAAIGCYVDNETPGHRLFHACEPLRGECACNPSFLVLGSCEPVHEGSELCPECMAIVRKNPVPVA